MENISLSNEIFDILKGSNFNVSLYKIDGNSTVDADEATRFYCEDQDLMISLRYQDTRVEVLVQAGESFDVVKNSDLISILKDVAHKNLGEFTVKRFDKKLTPKDFAHQSVTESASFGKTYGSVKTSYLQVGESTRLIIKHSKAVNEEVRGSRSRNIQNLFIENSQGEKFKFPHKYMAGAKAMAKHVSMGGTPYDTIGESILSMCEEVSSLNKFLKHVKGKGLVNEDNNDIVETVRGQLREYKDQINSLSTNKGYNNFQVQEEVETVETDSNIANKFLKNTFTEEFDSVLEKVARIVSVKEAKVSLEQETLRDFMKMFQDKVDFGLSFDENDPEHPNNEDPKKYSGSQGALAKLSQLLAFFAMRSKNDKAANYMAKLSDMVHNMEPKHQNLVAQMVVYLQKTANKTPAMAENVTMKIDEDVIFGLRKKIS